MIDTDEIQEALQNIDTSNQEALATAEKLAAKRQKALELALSNEKSWLKKRDQYKT